MTANATILSFPGAAPGHDHPADGLGRDTAIAQIKAALEERSSLRWSVTGGRGTAWGWITVKAQSAKHEQTQAEAEELARLFGLTSWGMCHQHLSIPASDAHRREYVDRAEGVTPCVTGEQYWD